MFMFFFFFWIQLTSFEGLFYDYNYSKIMPLFQANY